MESFLRNLAPPISNRSTKATFTKEKASTFSQRQYMHRVFYADGSSEEKLRSIVEEIETTLGPIAVAVYNIGAQVGNRPLMRTSERIMKFALRQGVEGAFAFSKALCPVMSKRRRGTLLFTSSTAAMRGSLSMSCFCVCTYTLVCTH